MHAVDTWEDLVVGERALLALPLQGGGFVSLAGSGAVDPGVAYGRHATRSGDTFYPTKGPGHGTLGKYTYNADSFLSVPHDTYMDVQQISVEFWFRVPDTASNRGLAGRDSGAGSNRPWVINILSTGAIQAYSNNSLGPVKATTRTTMDDNRWHHFCWTYDAATGLGEHYCDGVLDNAYSGGGSLATTTDAMAIYRQGAATGTILVGGMAFLAFYGYVLTASQVRAHYECIANRSPHVLEAV